MRTLVCMLTLLALMLAGTVSAQDTERKLTKKEKKALAARVDSLQFVSAEQAINEKHLSWRPTGGIQAGRKCLCKFKYQLCLCRKR